MNKQITFDLKNNDSWIKLTDNYFIKSGFRKTNETKESLAYENGSTLLNLVTFNPLNWKSVVTVSNQNESIAAEFNIDTTGQLVTLREEKLWDSFIENYKTTVNENIDLTHENARQIRETKRNSWKYFKWALIGGIAVGVPSGFLAYITGIDTIASMGAIGGAIAFMMNKIEADRKKGV